MNSATKLEHRASSSRSKHEGEPSIGLCDRLSRTRDNSQRQLPTDHDYAVPTREYQTDQSSLKPAQAAARSVLEKQKQRQKQTHRIAELTRSLHISPDYTMGCTHLKTKTGNLQLWLDENKAQVIGRYMRGCFVSEVHTRLNNNPRSITVFGDC
jgi:hypothetical protein